MRLLKLFVCAVLPFVVIISSCNIAFAEDAITIDSVTFYKYIDEFGMEDESLVCVKVSFTSGSAEQVSILLASENISEISNETKSKVIFMDQTLNSNDGVYEFAIEKSRISSATDLMDINGCTLYIKLGGTNIADMATKTITYNDPYVSSVIPGDVDGDLEITNLDGTYLLRFLAGWTLNNVQQEAMDVDDDGEITNLDGTFLLRYLAGWNIELKRR